MKKILVVLASFIAVFIILHLILKPEKALHKRLGQIPPDAVWVGGKDGGQWYKITKALENNAFKIRIYYESTGEMKLIPSSI